MFGVSSLEIAALDRAEKIQLVDVGKGDRNAVTLRSIKSYCEGLLAEFEITRRRRISTNEVASLLDEELLPFPRAETIGREELWSILSSSRRKEVVHALLAGKWGSLPFDAYRLTDSHPWRFSRSSVLACARGRSKAAELKEGE